MILEDIEEKLKETDARVFYGIADDSIRESRWDFTVFARKNIKYPGNKTAASDYFDVLIARENYIPDGHDMLVVEKMCSLPGVRQAGDATFDYVQKPNTNIVIEMLTIPFMRARKANG